MTPARFVNTDHTIAAAAIPGLYMAVFGTQAWTDATHREYVEWSAAQYDAFGGLRAALVYSGSQPVSAGQRRLVAEKLAPQWKVRTNAAIVTESGVARMSMNSLGIVLKLMKSPLHMRAFKPARLAESYPWLGEVSAFDRAPVLAEMRAMMDAVGYRSELITQLGAA